MLRGFFRYYLMSGLMSFIIFLFSSISFGGETDALVYISQPDELIIYEGDMAYAKDTTQINAQDMIEIELPSTAILKSLIIYDGGKRVEYFSLPETVTSPQPSPYTLYEERISRFPISTATPTSAPPLSSAQKNLVNWKTSIKGNRQVVLEYSLNGISWSPIYDMNILSNKKAALFYRAMITNKLTPLKDVKIKLASGMAGKLQPPRPYYNVDWRLSPEVAKLYDISIETRPDLTPSLRLNASYTYELGKQNLDKGTTFIELFDKELEYKKEFIWAIFFGQRVDVNYEIKNMTKQTFAQGMVDVYQNELYLGSDKILSTLPGWTANITFCGIDDIKVDKIIDVTYITDRNYKRNHHEVELRIENLSNKEIRMKIFEMKYRDAAEMEWNLKPVELTGGTMLWEISIPAKGTRAILYDFYADNTYLNPYQPYY